MPRRRTILAGMAGFAAASHGAAAAWEPTRPIQLIVGFAPGGGADLAAAPSPTPPRACSRLRSSC